MKESYKNIEEMLSRWYEGDADPELSRAILSALCEREDLPEDLIAEREFFLAMEEAAAAPVEMPEEYSARIDSAMANEFASGVSRRNPISSRRRLKRRIMYVAASAASLLIALAGFRIWDVDPVDDNPEPVIVATNSPALPKEATAAPVQIQDGAGDKTDSDKADKAEIKKPATKPATQSSVIKDNAVTDESAGDAGEAYDDYSEYIAENYRVVENEMEASTIINGIFASLNSRIVEVGTDVNDIGIDYEMRVAEL